MQFYGRERDNGRGDERGSHTVRAHVPDFAFRAQNGSSTSRRASRSLHGALELLNPPRSFCRSSTRLGPRLSTSTSTCCISACRRARKRALEATPKTGVGFQLGAELKLLDRPSISYHRDLRPEPPPTPIDAIFLIECLRCSPGARKAAFSTSVNDHPAIFV